MNSSGHKYSVFCNLLSLVRLQENQAVSAEDQVENRSPTVATVNSWVKRALASTSIRRKIGAGYALAVGIALLGTSAGLAIGEHYQRQSFAQLTRAHRQEHLLRELQAAILQARSHASRFPVVLGNSLWLQYEKDEFVRSLNKAKATISETERFVNPSSNGATADTEKLQDLLKTAAITIEAYGRLTASLLEQIDPWNLKPDEILPAQQELLRNSSGEVAITLDRLFHQLNRVIEAAQKEDMQATATLERAGELRVQIIVASMLLSVAIASALAVYTTRAIVQPIRDVTNVAQQVTQESNFALKAPVTSNDEVGVLATSLNQLIQRIAAYTQELKQAEVQLIHTEKMSSLGAMVAGIAHEINNPVNFIYGNLDYISEYIEDLLSLLRLYQQQYPEPLLPIQKQLEVIDFDFLAEDLPKILSSMKGGANRIREIVLSLRNFSRLDEAGMKPVNIHEGIDNTLLILNSRLKQGIKVIKEYGELPLVECTPAPINQVFMNLLCNAIDALEEVKVERLKLEGSEDNLQPSNLQSATPCIWIRTEVSGQNSVVIRIADNGSGIGSTIKHQIFDPFFTTKNPGKGTGLGLTITYQIITQHQGKIEVNSTPAQGTEFTIILPIKTSK